jgi:hypothetical protein
VAGVPDQFWEISDIVALLEEVENQPKKHGR